MKIQNSLVQAALLESLAQGMQSIAVFAADDQLLYANKTFLALFALDPHGRLPLTFATIMRHCYEGKKGLIIQTDDFPGWLDGVQERRRGQDQRGFEADFCDGRWIWVNETQSADGVLTFIGTDITALKRNEYALSHDRDRALKAANTDTLTGLCNRRHIFECLEAALRMPVNADLSVILCMFDLDHFKQINDQYGHHVGDLVLQHFAASVGSQLRPHDILGRIGGEEFLLILHASTPTDALHVIERLRLHLAEALPLHDGAPLRYTFSAGVTVILPGDSIPSLMQRADVALYAAKRAGRDRCVMSDCGA